MKKVVLFFLAVLMATALVFTLPAAPAAAAGEKSIKLVSIQFIGGKGIVFVFDVKGKFDSFEGSVNYKNVSYPLICNFRDDGKLSCTIRGGTQMAGKTVSGSLNGFFFSGTVPYKTYCSPVFDIDNNGTATHPSGWEQQGTYCQETRPEAGEVIYWYNPEWEYYFSYTYAIDGSELTMPVWYDFDNDDVIDPGELVYVSLPSLGAGYYWW